MEQEADDVSVAGSSQCSRPRRARSLSSSRRAKAPTVLEMIDDELARLRPLIPAAAEAQELARIDLDAARKQELVELRNLRQNRDDQKERRLKLASRMQACVRGWLTRKRFVCALNRELVNQVGIAALLPDQLRDQLKGLQHHVHDLQYHHEDRVHACVRLQAWWRSISARRIVWVLRLTNQINALHRRMNAAAMKIGAWYRAHEARNRFRTQIQINMGLARARQMQEMELCLQVVIRLQRNIRAKLARKKVREARELRNELFAQAHLQNLELRDGAAEECVEVPVIEDQVKASPPRKAREFEKLEQAGLVPFYGSSAQQLIRHRIGGPTALRMQKRLVLGMGMLSEGQEDSGEEDDVVDDAELDHPSMLWDVYPEGISTGFLDGLDKDAWPEDGWGRVEDKRKAAAKRRKAARKRQKAIPACPTKVVMPPPSNTEKRARARGEAAVVSDLGSKETAAAVVEDLHPLLMNGPMPPQRVPLPPAGAPPRGRPRIRTPAQSPDDDEDEDGCWNGATSFFSGPRKARPGPPRSPADSPRVAVSERFRVAATAPPLALAN